MFQSVGEGKTFAKQEALLACRREVHRALISHSDRAQQENWEHRWKHVVVVDL